MNNQKTITSRGLSFEIRPGTTDEKVIDEVVQKLSYFKHGVTALPKEHWLDLGANIGTFSCLLCSMGASVTAFEPEPENYEILRRNLKTNGFIAKVKQSAVIFGEDKELDFFVCKGEYNKYRHTLRPVRGREHIKVACERFDDILDEKVDGIKLDIEGAELDILNCGRNWLNVRKIVMEYHFDFDRSVENFKGRMSLLADAGFDVKYVQIPGSVKSYDFFPAAKLVYCLR